MQKSEGEVQAQCSKLDYHKNAPNIGNSDPSRHELSFRVSGYTSYGFNYEDEIEDIVDDEEEKVETIFDLLRHE